MWPAILSLLMATLGVTTALYRMTETHGWRSVDFVYPNANERTNAINNKSYIPGNPLPIDIDVAPDGRQFITTPKLLPGTPATLSVLSSSTSYSPGLVPYPNFQWHKEGQCNGLTSVWRIKIDTCGRLWALDCGVVDVFNTAERICPPKLVVFNISTNQKITEHRFSDALLKNTSLLVNVVVDLVHNSCQDAYAYIADITTYALIVFSLKTNRSWRVEHNYFYPDPLWGHFNIAGGEFDLMDGVLGLAVSPQLTNGDRRLYWHSFASVNEFWVYTSVLQNESNFANGVNSKAREFHVLNGRRTSQSTAEAMTSNALMFYSQVSNYSVSCWNTCLPFEDRNIVTVEQDYERLQFVTGTKIIRGQSGLEELWMLSNRMQRAILGNMNGNDINFRVLTATVRNLVSGTVCAHCP